MKKPCIVRVAGCRLWVASLGGLLVLLLFPIGVALTQASQPVHKTVTGCVSDGVLYSLQEFNDTAGRRTMVAYPLKVNGLGLSRYEGRKVSVEGYLLPGDRFNPIPKTLKVLGPCDKKSRAAISAR